MPTSLNRRHLLALAGLAATGSATRADPARVATVASNLVNPWGLAFLPDGRMLVSERAGRLRVLAPDGRAGAPLAGLPPVVAEGQGGLLDVAVAPDFASSRLVFWSFSEPASDGDGNGTALARARLEGTPGAERLAEVQVIFRQAPKVASRLHFGSRIAFGRDGRLFLTLGDRFSRKDDAQTLDTHLGKILRLDMDGKAPSDNPFVGRAGALPEIWSYGHRNVQGAAVHPETGALWATEHGPQGGDELNLVQRGANHGWPVITYGRNYGIGTRIGEGTERTDVVAPLAHWVPTSIAPSGLAFLTSDRYGDWKGSLFLGALRAQALVRITLEGNRVAAQQRLLQALNERIRSVVQGPDGLLYLLTDNAAGRVLRLLP